MKKTNKKAQGHVELMISFVIFMGFITILLFFLNPLKQNQIDYTLLDMTEQVLLKSWYTEYKTSSIMLNQGVSGCFIAENSIGLNGNIRVFDEDGHSTPSELSGSIRIQSSSSSDRHYKIYASKDFSKDSMSGCSALDGGTYTFGSLTNYNKTVLYENIVSFVRDYNADYAGLKKKLGLRNDFTVRVYKQPFPEQEAEMLLNATIFIPKFTEVIARDIPVLAINKNAEKLNLIINIRAW